MRTRRMNYDDLNIFFIKGANHDIQFLPSLYLLMLYMKRYCYCYSFNHNVGGEENGSDIKILLLHGGACDLLLYYLHIILFYFVRHVVGYSEHGTTAHFARMAWKNNNLYMHILYYKRNNILCFTSCFPPVTEGWLELISIILRSSIVCSAVRIYTMHE